MKLGIFYDHLTEACEQEKLPLQDVLICAYEQGIRYVEMDGFYYMENEQRVEDTLRRAGLKVGCVDVRLDLAHQKGMDDGEKLIRFAAQHGVANVLVIPGFVEEGDTREDVLSAIIAGLKPLAHVAAGFHINCMLEDYDDERAPYGTWQELRYLLEHVEGLGICFDTGNFAYFGQEEREAFKQLRPFIRMVHLKDRAERGVEPEKPKQAANGRELYPCAVGDGFIAVREIVSALLDSGYNGLMTIEHYDSARQLKRMCASAAYVKTLWKAI